MTDIGRIALILALVGGVGSALILVRSVIRGDEALAARGRQGMIAVFGLFTVAILAMVYALLDRDFSIDIVLNHSSRDLSIPYTISALYSDKAGSLLFWGWLISLFTVLLVIGKRDSFRNLMPAALAILAVIQVFFLFLVIFVVNVFEKNPAPPADGFGLNPLLQNFGMMMHPPLLFLGYSGFAVVFAFTLAGLISGSDRSEWIHGVRRWTLFAWCALGLGNLVGAWWAYVELGWGGYWVWDPVENASLMPWLLGTAFLHSIAIQRKTGYLKTWGAALILFTFIFTLLSPFITHGGIESPLHGFPDSPFPPYIMAFMLVTLAGSFAVFFLRRDYLQDEGTPSSLVSREGAFLFTNFALILTVFFTLFGTLAPGLSDSLGGKEITVERNFFDRTAAPGLMLVVLLMGICPLLASRQSSIAWVRRQFLFPIAFGVVAAAVILISGIGNWYALGALVCGIAIAAIAQEWFRGTGVLHRSPKVRHGLLHAVVLTLLDAAILLVTGIRMWSALVAIVCGILFFVIRNYLPAFTSLIWANRPRYGGFIAHIGVILITIGIIGSSMYDVEKTATLRPGDSMALKGYTLTYDNLSGEETTKKFRTVATMSVWRGEDRVATMHPKMEQWQISGSTTSEAAIRSTPADDVFISLTGYDGSDRSATIRALVVPLVIWLWIGGAVLLLGTVIAFWPGRRSSALSASGDTAVEEMDLDLAAGRITEEEYRDLEDRSRSGVAAPTGRGRAPGENIEDEIEREVRQLRQGKPMFCPQCGAKHLPQDRFCPGCGTRLSPKGRK